MKEPFAGIKDCEIFCMLELVDLIINCLQTGLIVSLFKSVRSRQTLKAPLGFFTITNEFNHSGLTSLPSNLEIILSDSMLSNSCLNLSFMANGTCLGGFWTGVACCFIIICTGLHFDLPISVKSLDYFRWLMIDCFVSVPKVSSLFVEFTLSVCKVGLALACMESTLS